MYTCNLKSKIYSDNLIKQLNTSYKSFIRNMLNNCKIVTRHNIEYYSMSHQQLLQFEAAKRGDNPSSVKLHSTKN